MTPTEQRYAQIEKEAIAFTWACDRLADYLICLKFHIHATVEEEVGPQNIQVSTADQSSYRRNRGHLIRLPEEVQAEGEILTQLDANESNDTAQPGVNEPRRTARINQQPERLDPSLV